MVLTKGSIVCANNRVFAGCDSVRQPANLNDIPSQYVHPSSKVCVGGDASTLNGKTAEQILSEASEASSVVVLYDSTIDASSWTSSITTVRTYAYQLSSSDLYKYIAFGVHISATIHYRTSSSYSSDDHEFTISLAKNGTYANWSSEHVILKQYPTLANADNTSSGEFNFYGNFSMLNSAYLISYGDNTNMTQVAICGYTSNGIANGANLNGSTVHVQVKAVKA